MAQRRGHGGRPKLREADPGEKITISVRITPDMKRRLEEVAAYNGRSQSQEAELRLERSFARDDLLVDALYLRYSQEVAGIVLAVGETMNTHGCVEMSLLRKPETPTQHDMFDLVERRWAAYPAVLDVGLITGIALLAMLRPQEGAESVTENDRRLAIDVAQGFLYSLVKGPHRKDEPAFIRQKRETICSLLGPSIMEQIKRRSAHHFQDLEQAFHELAAAARKSKEKGKKQ